MLHGIELRSHRSIVIKSGEHDKSLGRKSCFPSRLPLVPSYNVSATPRDVTTELCARHSVKPEIGETGTRQVSLAAAAHATVADCDVQLMPSDECRARLY